LHKRVSQTARRDKRKDQRRSSRMRRLNKVKLTFCDILYISFITKTSVNVLAMIGLTPHLYSNSSGGEAEAVAPPGSAQSRIDLARPD